jgi:phospholipid/cholesterol/gamma-HCH transport system substrate-binding protein
MLQDKDRITLTQSAVVLEKLIGQFIYGRAEGGNSAKPEPAVEVAPPGKAPAPPDTQKGEAPAGK